MTTPIAWPAVERTNWPSWAQPQLTACHAKNGDLLVQYEGKTWTLYWEGNLYAGTYWPVSDDVNNVIAASVWAEEQLGVMKAHPCAGSMLWHAQHKKLVDRPGAKSPGDLDKKPVTVLSSADAAVATETPPDPVHYQLKPREEAEPVPVPRKKRKLFTKDERDEEV